MPDLHLTRRLRSRVTGALAIAVVTATLLGGCVGIPRSGPVNPGLSLTDGAGVANIAFNPEGPERGASQLNILKGFIASFTSATGGYAVAKKFLTTSFQGKWSPNASVQVRSGQAKILPIDDSTMEYSFDAIASVNQNGAYSEESQSSALTFGFVREGGQWRINAAPDGIVLADQTFQRIFSQDTLYFLDAGNNVLVPDLRWFPNGTAVSSRIVAAVLAGPPDWLKGAAFSRFPDGTQLSNAGSVITPDSGIARVDLTKEALSASATQRQLMKLQLTESLRSVGSISSVDISVEGVPLTIDDLGASAPLATSSVDSQALVLQKKEFGFYANKKIARLGVLSSRVEALSPSAATLSSDQQSVAVLDSAGVALVRKGTTAALLLDPRPGLIAPSLDEYGYVWSVPRNDPSALTVFDPSGVGHPIMTSLPSGSQIVSLEVSREGARVEMLLATPTGPRLVVAAILRDDKFVPTSVGAPIIDASIDDGDAIDSTWVDELTVATLVMVGGQSRVEVYVIGGRRSSLGEPFAAADQIVGGNRGADGLWVLGSETVDGRQIYSYHGSSWQSTNVAVDFIATQR